MLGMQIKVEIIVQLGRQGRSDGQGGEGTIEDPELLMMVMETREQIEGTESAEDLQRLQQDNSAQRDKCISVRLACGSAITKGHIHLSCV